MQADSSSSAGRRPLILVIDDNQADLDLFGEAIAELGENVECATAKSVQEGIRLIEAGKASGSRLPELIILDLCMPRHDGRHLLRHLRGCPGLDRIPVVVLSSSSWSRDRDECLALGASHYRVKPLDWSSYLELIVFLRSLWCCALPGRS